MSEPSLDDDLTAVELAHSRERYLELRERLHDLRTGVVIRCHELGWATDGTDASILRQLDEVVKRWHEAEQVAAHNEEQARLNKDVADRVAFLEAEVFQYRSRSDVLAQQVNLLQNEVNTLRLNKPPNTYGGGGVPTVF